MQNNNVAVMQLMTAFGSGTGVRKPTRKAAKILPSESSRHKKYETQ